MEGQEATVAVIAIVAVVVLLLVWLFMQRRRTQILRDEFGEEYDRTVDVRGGTRDAEADLIERKERVKKLEIRPLSVEERDRYTADWQETKALFVDSPVEAVSRADRLLTQVMNARGYPMADFENRHADLTVDHGEVAKHYLAGHEIADRSSEATTEELRRAINHYEALFSDMTSEVAASDVGNDRIVAHDVDGDGDADIVEREEAPTRPAAFSTTTRRPE